MACTYYIETSFECVFMRHSGDFLQGEAANMIRSIFDDSEYKTGFNILRDLTGVTLPEEHNFHFFKEME